VGKFIWLWGHWLSGTGRSEPAGPVHQQHEVGASSGGKIGHDAGVPADASVASRESTGRADGSTHRQP
jgi:hypothetical protein